MACCEVVHIRPFSVQKDLHHPSAVHRGRGTSTAGAPLPIIGSACHPRTGDLHSGGSGCSLLCDPTGDRCRGGRPGGHLGDSRPRRYSMLGSSRSPYLVPFCGTALRAAVRWVASAAWRRLVSVALRPRRDRRSERSRGAAELRTPVTCGRLAEFGKGGRGRYQAGDVGRLDGARKELITRLFVTMN